MIDVSKCKYEECFESDEFEGIVYHYTYPIDFNEAGFCKDDYRNVVMMCLSLTYDNGNFCLEMSPTVEDEAGLLDVDWKELHEGINYDTNTICSLLGYAVESLKGEYGECAL